MAQPLSPNKLNDRDKRRYENIRSRLRSQGVGEDDAGRRALEELAAEGTSGSGGGSNSGGGDSPKPTHHGGTTRTGSRAGTDQGGARS